MDTYVKLSTVWRASCVQRNHLSSKKVLAIGEAVRDLDGMDSAVVDDF
jgi:hypothetical protein